VPDTRNGARRSSARAASRRWSGCCRSRPTSPSSGWRPPSPRRSSRALRGLTCGWSNLL